MTRAVAHHQDVAGQTLQVGVLEALAEDDGEGALGRVDVADDLQRAFGIAFAALHAGPLAALHDTHVGGKAAEQGEGIAGLEPAEVADDFDPVEATLAQTPFRRQAQVLHFLDGVAQHPGADGVDRHRVPAADQYVQLDTALFQQRRRRQVAVEDSRDAFDDAEVGLHHAE